MAATGKKTSNIELEWNKLFPTTVTDSCTSSIKFMKLLTTVAISMVCSLKKILPEDNYKVETFAGLRLSILKTDCDDELAQFISKALLQALEAFDKRYLDRLALCFYRDECKKQNLMECYIFEYSYKAAGVTMSLHTKTKTTSATTMFTTEKARQQTKTLLESCHDIVQNAFQYPPPAYEIGIRLYYNDDAPEGYQAPGFSDATDQTDHLDFDQELFEIGHVATPYHTMVALCRSNTKCTMQETDTQDSWASASQKAFPTQNTPVMSSGQTNDMYMDFNDAETVVIYGDRDGAPVVGCPCNTNDKMDLKLITCRHCGYRQHAVCYGIVAYSDSVEALAGHCCVRCFDNDNKRKSTDEFLSKLSPYKRKSLCIFRRTLDLLRHKSEIEGATLARVFNMEAEGAQKLIRRLTDYGVIKRDAHANLNAPVHVNLVQRINKEKLKETMRKHFKISDTGLADRLLSDYQTLSQKRDEFEPIKDVLGSMELVTLQNDTELDRVLKRQTVIAKQVKDGALKQYEEALSYVNDIATEDLPLSGEHNPVKVVEKTKKSGVITTTKRKIQDDGGCNDGENRLRSRTAAKKKKTSKQSV